MSYVAQNEWGDTCLAIGLDAFLSKHTNKIYAVFYADKVITCGINK